MRFDFQPGCLFILRAQKRVEQQLQYSFIYPHSISPKLHPHPPLPPPTALYGKRHNVNEHPCYPVFRTTLSKGGGGINFFLGLHKTKHYRDEMCILSLRNLYLYKVTTVSFSHSGRGVKTKSFTWLSGLYFSHKIGLPPSTPPTSTFESTNYSFYFYTSANTINYTRVSFGIFKVIKYILNKVA